MKYYVLAEEEVRNLIRGAGDYAVKQYRIEQGEESPFISQRKAYKLFGSGNVKKWVSLGLIKKPKDGKATSNIRYDHLKLKALSEASNRHHLKFD